MDNEQIDQLKLDLKGKKKTFFVYYPGEASTILESMVLEVMRTEGERNARIKELRASHGTFVTHGEWRQTEGKTPHIVFYAEGSGVSKMSRDLAKLATKVPKLADSTIAPLDTVGLAGKFGARTKDVAAPIKPKAPTKKDVVPVPDLAIDATGGKMGKQVGGGSYGSVSVINGVDGPNGTKLVGKSFYGTPEDGKRKAKEEAELYAKAGNHENIVRSHGVQKVDGSTVLVMESMSGGDVSGAGTKLRQKLESGELTHTEYWGAVQSMMRDTLQGLSYLESQGMLHNDIKGDNVMIAEDGTAKLVDLGELSKIGDDVKPGHAAYMAPDRLEKGAKGGSTHDSFSAGQLTHSVVTGTDLAPGEDVVPKGHGGGRFQVSSAFSELKKALDTTDEKGKVRNLKPVKPEKGSQGYGKTTEGYDSAFAKFLEELMHPNPELRLSPTEALKHPFLTDSVLGAEEGRKAIRKALGLGQDAPKTATSLGDARTAAQKVYDERGAWKTRMSESEKAIDRATKFGVKLRADTDKGKIEGTGGAEELRDATKALDALIDTFTEGVDKVAPASRDFTEALATAAKSAPNTPDDTKLAEQLGKMATSLTKEAGRLRDAVLELRLWAKGMDNDDTGASRKEGTKTKDAVRKRLDSLELVHEEASTLLQRGERPLAELRSSGLAKDEGGKLKASLQKLRVDLTAVKPKIDPAAKEATSLLADLRKVIGGKTGKDAADRFETERKLEIRLAGLHRNLPAVDRQIGEALSALAVGLDG